MSNPFNVKDQDAPAEAVSVEATDIPLGEHNAAFDGGQDALDGETAMPAKVDMPSNADRRVVRRRIVPKVELKHLAQDLLGHGIANVLGYALEDIGNQQKLAELGVSPEVFATVLFAQADRAAKTLGFERAWKN